MTSSVTDIIKKIQDSQPAEINLPLLDGSSAQLTCIYKESFAPNFFLLFSSPQLPPNLDTSKSCLVTVEGRDKTIAINAGVEEIKGSRILELFAQKIVDPITLRTHYRADLRTAITACYEPGPDEQTLPWCISGETLDLSAGGTLAIFPAEFPCKNRISIHIQLPQFDKDIRCLAHVVRMRKLRKEHWQVSMQFDGITQKERDIIVACCLREQRRRLQEKVRTAQ